MNRVIRRVIPVSVALIAASAGVAYATGALSASPNTIVGCAKNVNGQLRIVESPSDCGPSEHAVQFAGPQAPSGPAEVTVDCAAGQSVNQALADTADASQVDITVKGTCTESVQVRRDKVALHGAAPGDGLAQPAGSNGVLTVVSARRVFLDQLTITGGQWGLSVLNGSSVQANNLHVAGASDQDVVANGETSLDLNNSTIDGAQTGIAAQSGAISVDGGTVTGSHTFGVSAEAGGSVMLGGGVVVSGVHFHGVIASSGGSVQVKDATVEGSGGTGVFAFRGGTVSLTQAAIVRNNAQGGVGANAGTAEVDGHVTGNGGCGGVCGYDGGRVTIQNGAVIDANTSDGVDMSVGSTLSVGQSQITNNARNGVHLQDMSVAGFSNDNQITGNGQWGVFCDGSPAVAMITHGPGGIGTVTGNPSGTVRCPGA